LEFVKTPLIPDGGELIKTPFSSDGFFLTTLLELFYLDKGNLSMSEKGRSY